jgi:SAM-dependent methyltransferase
MKELDGSNEGNSSVEHPIQIPDSLKWERVWDIFNNQFFDYKRDTELIYEWISRKGYHVKDILDLGCGAGHHLLHLKRLGYNCAGMDKNNAILQYARQFIIGDGTSLYLGDILQEPVNYLQNRFDLILAKHLSFSAQDTERLLVNAQKLLRGGGPKLVTSDFLITNGESLEKSIFSMDVYTEDDFHVARINNMELAQGMNKYNWQELYLLGQKGGMLDIKISSRSLWFYTVNDVMKLLDKVGISIDHSDSEITGITGLSGVTIYGRFRD